MEPVFCQLDYFKRFLTGFPAEASCPSDWSSQTNHSGPFKMSDHILSVLKTLQRAFHLIQSKNNRGLISTDRVPVLCSSLLSSHPQGSHLAGVYGIPPQGLGLCCSLLPFQAHRAQHALYSCSSYLSRRAINNSTLYSLPLLACVAFLHSTENYPMSYTYFYCLSQEQEMFCLLSHHLKQCLSHSRGSKPLSNYKKESKQQKETKVNIYNISMFQTLLSAMPFLLHPHKPMFLYSYTCAQKTQT